MYNSISPSRCNVLHLYILLDNNVYRPLKRLTIKTGTMSRTFFISSCLKYSHYCYDWCASFLVHCCFCLLLILILKNKIDWFSSNYIIVHVPKYSLFPDSLAKCMHWSNRKCVIFFPLFSDRDEVTNERVNSWSSLLISLPETCVLNGRLIWEVKTTQVASLHIPFSEQVLYIEAKVSALIFIFIISNASKSNDLND